MATATKRFGPLDLLPVRVEVRHGEAGRDSERILTEAGAWGSPILGVFDSWGSVNVPQELMHRIAHNRFGEVTTTFGPNWFSRREDLNADILDVVFGGCQLGEYGPDPYRLRDQLEGVVWWLRTGSQWREVPEEFGAWSTI
ncbi:transposase [Streptomyces rimosus]|uniref:transposase n=1 Tax=Streptomyces rimosus TaxID=1927 RepID=UPI0037991A02